MTCLMHDTIRTTREEECHRVRAEGALFISGFVVCCRCNWVSKPREEGARDCSGLDHVARKSLAPNGTVMCRWHGVPEMVTPAMRKTAVLLVL